jgi:hypothetical protein
MAEQSDVSYLPAECRSSASYAELLQLCSTFLTLVCPSSTRSARLSDNKHFPCHAFCISSSSPHSPRWSQSNLPARLPVFIRPTHLSIPFQYFISHSPSGSIPYLLLHSAVYKLHSQWLPLQKPNFPTILCPTWHLTFKLATNFSCFTSSPSSSAQSV